ncbi:MAG: cytochrome c-type biogenesis protein CcmH [Candidatus Acidiferrum sp.]
MINRLFKNLSFVRRRTALQASRHSERSPRSDESLFSRAHLPQRVAFLFVLLALAFAPLVTAQVGYSQHAKQIGTHLKCMCKGCDMSAGLCAHPGGSFSGPCDTAKSELKEIDQLLAQGKSEQQIIDAFVAEYGTVVYVEPPKKGFGLVAWLMPIFYSVVGLTVLVVVVRKWAVHPSAVSSAQGPTVHNEALDRARAQAARETED